MRSLTTKLGLLSAALLLGASPAKADGVRLWNVCGGTSAAFQTCATVQVTVTGTSVELRVRNLAGTGAASNAPSWVITNVGIDNLPVAINAMATPAATTSGPTRGADLPASWAIYNNLSNGGGIKVDVGLTNAAGMTNALASNCAAAGSLPGGSNQLYLTTNTGCAGTPGYAAANAGLNGGWLVFTFAVNQTFDPNAVGSLFYKAQNGPNGLSTECITGGKNTNCYDVPEVVVTPEPATMTLLATGLVGIIGGARRRRRKALLEG